jgi:hypothetical protein
VVLAPAPDVSFGVDGQSRVKGMTLVGIDAMRTPAGKITRTGLVKEFALLPSPSWPCVPRPPGVQIPAGQQGVLGRVRRPDLSDPAGHGQGNGRPGQIVVLAFSVERPC